MSLLLASDVYRGCTQTVPYTSANGDAETVPWMNLDNIWLELQIREQLTAELSNALEEWADETDNSLTERERTRLNDWIQSLSNKLFPEIVRDHGEIPSLLVTLSNNASCILSVKWRDGRNTYFKIDGQSHECTFSVHGRRGKLLGSGFFPAPVPSKKLD